MIERTRNKKWAIWLENRYLSLAHTGCAKIMTWLPILHAFLNRKSKTAKRQFFKDIAFRLSLETFKLSQSIFKFGYFIGERRLFLLTGKSNSAGIHELCINLADCGDKVVIIGKIVSGLKQFGESVE
jgi:hypothetical protein